MISFDERFSFYTNNIFTDFKSTNWNVPNEYLVHRQNKPILIYEKNYEIEKIRMIHFCYNLKYEKPFMFIANDGFDNCGFPCFQKTRTIENHSKLSILLKLEYFRHWAPFYTYNDNIKWEDKKNELIYRGAPTGTGDRINFVSKYYKEWNVGLSCVLQHHGDKLNYLLKPSLTINDFYNYKYIISIEGNEKDSGINWKLASNSLVMMKPPIFESWLMESYLKPFVHYVPLNDDFSNLDEMYNWCLNNDDKCREIVKNANSFMNNFKDVETEEKLINEIKNNYYNNFSFH